jgi:exonuclease SbcC
VTMLERRLAHSAADLAARLEADHACPVCGSLDHPRPARSRDGELVSDADLTSAEDAVAAAEAHDTAAQSAAEASSAAMAAIQSTIDGLQGRLGDVDVDSLAGSLAVAQAAVAQARTAADSGRQLTSRLAELDAQVLALVEQRSAATAAVAEADALLASHIEAIAREAEALRMVVGADSTATAAIAEARAEAAAIDAALDAFEAAAGRSIVGDLGELESAAAAAHATAGELRSQLEQAREIHTRLMSTREAVESLAEAWVAAREEISTILSATDTAVSLAGLVSAQSKANTLRLTLQSYAVQRRFRTVLEAATVHLERMSGSRFAFELDESVGRGHSGLGIAVRDQWSGTLRDPKALSGGETFIASLALALGLADVVREENGGVDLQTLFVDEGFGSLDQEALQQVLDQLDALRTRGRVVGVISHVTEMKDWVHDRVIVEPGSPGRGSRLVQPA